MNLSYKLQSYLTLGLIFITNLTYFVWSFAFTDPNLVFTSWPPFWAFQQFMWQLPKHNMTFLYSAMLTLLFFCSIWLSRLAPKVRFGFKKWITIFFLVSTPLLFSNNALSHDVFNYIFNARMVVKYQMNPHVEVAQHFFYDPWIRFMHNVHTPAPYFYGWTVLSLVPYILGFEKFVLTWLLFRAWSIVGFGLALIMVRYIMKKQENQDIQAFVLVLFNPLLILELISNSHNDGWMIWPALASLLLVMKKGHQISWINIAVSLLLLLFSASTKYVTLLLLPIWVIMVLQQFKAFEKLTQSFIQSFKLSKIPLNWFDLSAIILFLPLLTPRSHQFNPWYLSWCLFFLPIMKNKLLKICLVALSISSMVRYIPWMWYGAFEYTKQIETNEKIITWVLAGIIIIFLLLVPKKTTPKS